MFKRLKTRLAMLNAAVAGLIVVTMAALAYLMVSGNIAKQSQQVLQVLTANVAVQAAGGEIDPNVILKLTGGLYPYFMIQMDSSRQNVQSNIKTDIGSDEVLRIAREIVAREAANKKSMAMLDSEARKKATANLTPGAVVDVGGNSFRYGTVTGKDGTTWIVLMDMQQERALQRSVLYSLLLCVAAALAAAFFGGRYLAGRSIAPIQRSWKRQRDFVADASHELRSPLAALQASLEAAGARQEATIADSRDFFDGMGEELGRMTRLVDDLLLMARTDSGAIVFRDDAVNIAQTAESAARLIQPVAAAKGLECRAEILAAPLVRGDGERLKQAILILLDNAVKYTPSGSVRVTVRYAQGKAIIEVADTGIGIEKEHMNGIFERFYRADRARGREAGGAGLGLSIAKWIVEAHRGSLSVESEPGKGSTFTVALPEVK